MIRVLLFILFFIILFTTLGLIIWAGVKLYSASSSNGFYDSKKTNTKGPAAFLIASICGFVASLALVICIPGSVHQVDTGSVAVVRHLGKIEGMRGPGTYFDFYMVNHYEIYDTKVQQDKIVTAAYSKDGQTMELEVFLQYQVQPEHIMDIATQYGSLDALQSRIETQTIEKTKAVMSSDIAMNIIQKRAEFSTLVSEAVRDGISADYFVNVRDVVLTNIDFTDEFERSVEAKVIAEQEKTAAITRAEAEKEAAIIKAQQELETAEIEAEKKIVEANANAEVIRIAAEAEAKATVARIIELARTLGFTVNETATGYEILFDAEHTEAMFKTEVEDYIKYLEYLNQWDGKLPEVVAGDDAISIIVP